MYRRNVTIKRTIILEHIRGWDYVPVDTGRWEKIRNLFPAKIMNRKDKKKFRMRYRDIPF